MYRCQLDFSIFCATSLLGISWQHLNYPNLLVHSVYRFHVYFHERLILHDLGAPLPYEDVFSKAKNGYIKSIYYSSCVNPNETWMYGDWFNTTHYAIFTSELKTTKKSPPDNLMQWIITQSRGFTRNGIKRLVGP